MAFDPPTFHSQHFLVAHVQRVIKDQAQEAREGKHCPCPQGDVSTGSGQPTHANSKYENSMMLWGLQKENLGFQVMSYLM